MEEIIKALIDSELARWFAVGFVVLVGLEVIALVIQTENKKNPLYWIDLLATTTVQVAHKRLKLLGRKIRKLVRGS